MSELEARFRVRLEGGDELSNFFRKSQRDAIEFQKVVTGALKDSAKQIGAFAVATGKSLASLALGNIGIASQAKSVLAFRDAVAQLTVTAGLAEDSMSGLRDQIHAVAKSSNQMQDDVTAALSAFVERTGDIEAARKNLELYGKVATATGASIKDVAYVGVELSSKLGIKDPRQQAEALAVLSQQGKMGAVEIRDLATKSPKIFSAANAYFGVSGMEGLRGTGALAQVFARAFGGNGTSAGIATSIDNAFKDMTKRKGLVDLMVGHNTTGQDPYEVMKQLVVATGGDAGKLLKNGRSGIFNMQALRGIGVLASEYRATGGFASFDRFKNASGDFGNVERDFALRRGTGQAKLNAAQISVAASSDRNLGDTFDRLANRANLLSDAFDFATRHLALTAGVAGVAVLGKNVGSAVLGRALFVQQVYITGAAPGVGLGGGAAGAFGDKAARVFGALAAASIGYAVGTLLDQRFGLSGKAAQVAGDVTGQTTARLLDEADASLAQRRKNKALGDERAARVKYYEGQGMSHGQALASADAIAEAIRQMKLSAININIADGTATADSGGTRAPSVMVRRGQMTYVQSGAQ